MFCFNSLLLLPLPLFRPLLCGLRLHILVETLRFFIFHFRTNGCRRDHKNPIFLMPKKLSHKTTHHIANHMPLPAPSNRHISRFFPVLVTQDTKWARH